VITETVAEPLGISLEEALVRMEQAYFEEVSASFAHLVTPDTTLAAFGGAGPMSATGAARPAGVKQVLVPRTAAVFSALGISFSDIGKTYEVLVPEPTTESVEQTYRDLLVRADRDMFQEGFELAGCEVTCSLVVEEADGNVVHRGAYQPGSPADHPGTYATLRLAVSAPLSQPELAADSPVEQVPAPVAGTRQVRSAADQVDTVPVHVLDDLVPGWTFRVTSAGDLLLTDTH
jgi:N-methylhydantoinase A/oxoprolinase/acetone carboxylase beta subunit